MPGETSSMLTLPRVLRTPTLPVSIVPKLHQPSASSGRTRAALSTHLTWLSIGNPPLLLATYGRSRIGLPRGRVEALWHLRHRLIQAAQDERGARGQQHHGHGAQQRLARDPVEQAPRDRDAGERGRHGHGGGDPDPRVEEQPGNKKSDHAQRDAGHGGEAERGAELLLRKAALREIDHVGRAAGPEERARDAAAEAGEPGPARRDDARGRAPRQAVERERNHEAAQQEHADRARQVDERADTQRGADDDHRHEPRPFAAHGFPRVLETHAQRAHQVGEREERQREGQRHDVGRERDRDERRAETGEPEDEGARERDRPERGEFARLHQPARRRLAPLERFIERSRFTYLQNGSPRRDSRRSARRRSSSHSRLGGSPLRPKATMFGSYSARIASTAPPNAVSSRCMYWSKRGSSSMKFTTKAPRGSSARNAAS